MIVNSILDIASQPLFLKLNDFVEGSECYLKIEGLNISGSIKIKSAKKMIESLEKQYGDALKEKILVCSSSGNLAIALSIICNIKKYCLVCVSDPNISEVSKELIKLYGTELIIVNEKDANGGYLAKRIEYINRLLQNDHRYLWFNQYANDANAQAHYDTTAREILCELPEVSYLFVGTGTTGTIMGCARYFKQYSPHTKIIAIDAEGSVTFGGLPKKRSIPGLGTSRRPELVNSDFFDDVIHIPETDTIAMCHFMLKEKGLLLGGSSGTVLAGMKQYQCEKNSVLVAILPDFGDKYLKTIYNHEWLQTIYNKDFVIHEY